jgi:gluconate 5-dehydrogenase
MPLETWQQIIDLNLTQAFICTKMIGGAMLARRRGRVINVSSISATLPGKPMRGRSYETSKAALSMFTKAVAADWATYNVTVNAIAPGTFLTDANRRWFRERPELRGEIEQGIPLGRLGEPDEIGALALYLASDASSYMTGAVLVIDGGRTLW